MKKIIISLVVLATLFMGYFYVNGIVLSNVYPVPDDVKINDFPGSEIVIAYGINKRESKGLLIKNGSSLAVLFHGNGSTVNDMFYAAKVLIKNDFSVLIVEYPGYGIMKKYKPHEKDIYYDAELLINEITKEGNYSQIIPFGYSIGTGVAIEMAKRNIGQKLVLLSGFSSMDDMISLDYPRIVAMIFNTEKFDNHEKAKDINIEALIVHGTKDEFVPHSMSKVLSNSFNKSKVLDIEGATHRIFSYLSDSDWNKIIQYMKEES